MTSTDMRRKLAELRKQHREIEQAISDKIRQHESLTLQRRCGIRL